MVRFILGTFVLVSVFLFESTNAYACFPQPQTRQMIASGQVLPIAQIRTQVLQSGFGRVQSVTLCPSGSGFVYSVIAINRSGQVSRLSVDARSGRVLR